VSIRTKNKRAKRNEAHKQQANRRLMSVISTQTGDISFLQNRLSLSRNEVQRLSRELREVLAVQLPISRDRMIDHIEGRLAHEEYDQAAKWFLANKNLAESFGIYDPKEAVRYLSSRRKRIDTGLSMQIDRHAIVVRASIPAQFTLTILCRCEISPADTVKATSKPCGINHTVKKLR